MFDIESLVEMAQEADGDEGVLEGLFQQAYDAGRAEGFADGVTSGLEEDFECDE